MKQNERDELLIRLDERTKETNRDVKELKKVLHGNGQEGLCDTVIRHDTTIKNRDYVYGVGLTVIIIIFSVINIFFLSALIL